MIRCTLVTVQRMAFLTKSKFILFSFLILTKFYLFSSYAFFLGDLNFRINDLTSQQVYDAVLIAERKKDANKWIPLLQYDQVCAKCKVFLPII